MRLMRESFYFYDENEVFLTLAPSVNYMRPREQMSNVRNVYNIFFSRNAERKITLRTVLMKHDAISHALTMPLFLLYGPFPL